MKIVEFLGLNWVKDQLDEINRKLDILLARSNEERNVSAELEAAIRQTSAMAIRIDKKVDDSTTNQK